MTSALDPKAWASLRALEAAGEPGFLRELTGEFLAQAPARIAELRGAGARGDASALEREAHGFKGSCGALGALGMADCCDRLEAIGRGGSCLGYAEVVIALEREWQAVRRALLQAFPDV